MKKIILTIVAILTFGFVNAQEKVVGNGDGQTSAGKWLIEIEAKTGSWTTGNTSFSLLSIDGGFTAWSIGFEGGGVLWTI